MRSVLLGLALLAACSSGVEPPPPDPDALPPEVFADVVADLAAARIEALPDTALYHRRRAEILREREVTAGDLAGFVAAYGRDDDVMARVYARVRERVDAVAGPPDARRSPGGGSGETAGDTLPVDLLEDAVLPPDTGR